MPTVVSCADCGKKLAVPDGIAATTARCPGCGADVFLLDLELEPPAPARQPEADPSTEDEGYRLMDTIPLQDAPPPKREPFPVQAEEPRRRKKRRRQREEDDEIVETVAVEDDETEQDEPRRRKRKRRSEAEPARGLGWLGWLALGVPALLILAVTLIGLARAGYQSAVLTFVVSMGIGLPVSLVILVLSMIISSAVVGGIEFGEAHIVVPKGGALLFVVNLISMIPVAGPFIALPVWYLGLMSLFRLDFFEARMLVLINWGLNAVFRVFLLGAILSSMSHAERRHEDLLGKLPPDQAAAVKEIEALGGTWEIDEDEGQVHVVSVNLNETGINDQTLLIVRTFPRLQSLDLERTRVTGAGLRNLQTLQHLEMLDLSNNPQLTDADVDVLISFKKLEELTVDGTRITEAGVRRLEAAIPGLEVHR